MTKHKLWLLISFVSLASCGHQDPVESNFDLVGPRMPPWYRDNPALDRDKTAVELTIHTSGIVDIEVKEKVSGKILERKYGRYDGSYGLPGKSMLEYPRYMVIAVDGEEETYEIPKPGSEINFSEFPPKEK